MRSLTFAAIGQFTERPFVIKEQRLGREHCHGSLYWIRGGQPTILNHISQLEMLNSTRHKQDKSIDPSSGARVFLL